MKGFDVIIEMSAHTNLQSDLELLGRKGRIVIVGGKDTVTISPALFIGKEATVTGVKLADSTPTEWKTMTDHVRRGVENGWLRPTLHKEYPLSEAATVSWKHIGQFLEWETSVVLLAGSPRSRGARKYSRQNSVAGSLNELGAVFFCWLVCFSFLQKCCLQCRWLYDTEALYPKYCGISTLE